MTTFIDGATLLNLVNQACEEAGINVRQRALSLEEASAWANRLPTVVAALRDALDTLQGVVNRWNGLVALDGDARVELDRVFRPGAAVHNDASAIAKAVKYSWLPAKTANVHTKVARHRAELLNFINGLDLEVRGRPRGPKPERMPSQDEVLSLGANDVWAYGMEADLQESAMRVLREGRLLGAVQRVLDSVTSNAAKNPASWPASEVAPVIAVLKNQAKELETLRAPNPAFLGGTTGRPATSAGMRQLAHERHIALHNFQEPINFAEYLDKHKVSAAALGSVVLLLVALLYQFLGWGLAFGLSRNVPWLEALLHAEFYTEGLDQWTADFGGHAVVSVLLGVVLLAGATGFAFRVLHWNRLHTIVTKSRSRYEGGLSKTEPPPIFVQVQLVVLAVVASGIASWLWFGYQSQAKPHEVELTKAAREQFGVHTICGVHIMSIGEREVFVAAMKDTKSKATWVVPADEIAVVAPGGEPSCETTAVVAEEKPPTATPAISATVNLFGGARASAVPQSPVFPDCAQEVRNAGDRVVQALSAIEDTMPKSVSTPPAQPVAVTVRIDERSLRPMVEPINDLNRRLESRMTELIATGIRLVEVHNKLVEQSDAHGAGMSRALDIVAVLSACQFEVGAKPTSDGTGYKSKWFPRGFFNQACETAVRSALPLSGSR